MTQAKLFTLRFNTTSTPGIETMSLNPVELNGGAINAVGASGVEWNNGAWKKLSVGTSGHTFTGMSGSATVKITNNGYIDMPWTAEVMQGADWCKITSGSSGVNYGTVTFIVDENPRGAPKRVTKIVIDAPGAVGSPYFYSVTQMDGFPLESPEITSPKTLPHGELGKPYYEVLTASGGKKPYTWSLMSGELPNGLNLSTDGVIIGGPKSSAQNIFTISVVGADGLKSSKQFELNVKEKAPVSQQCGDDATADDPLTTTGLFNGYLRGIRKLGNQENKTLLGTLSLKITRLSGQLTAKVVIQGGALSFKGKAWGSEDASGTFNSQLVTRGGETLDIFVRQNHVWGELTGGIFGTDKLQVTAMRNRFAERGDTTAQSLLERYSGYYTTILFESYNYDSATGTLNVMPQGFGFMTSTIRTKGKVKLAGVLADGTKISAASQLLECGELGSVPIFMPLYRKQGYFGGLALIDQGNNHNTFTASPDTDLFRWFKPGVSDGFDMVLDMNGGHYNVQDALSDKLELWFIAQNVDTRLHHASGAVEPVYMFFPTPLNINGNRMSVPRTIRPNAVKEGGKVTHYEYIGDNPSGVTLKYAVSSGIFRGKFNLYYDYEDPSGRFQHKAVSVPYAGVIVQLPSYNLQKAGYGHALLPSSDPAYRPYRLKVSFPCHITDLVP